MTLYIDKENGEGNDEPKFFLPDGTPVDGNGNFLAEDYEGSGLAADHDVVPETLVTSEGEGITPVGSPEDLTDNGEGEAEVESYDELTNAQIRAEISRRNEGRADEDKISLDGKKADMVAALDADDEAHADDDE